MLKLCYFFRSFPDDLYFKRSKEKYVVWRNIDLTAAMVIFIVNSSHHLGHKIVLDSYESQNDQEMYEHNKRRDYYTSTLFTTHVKIIRTVVRY